jgi:hypothetical protein
MEMGGERARSFRVKKAEVLDNRPNIRLLTRGQGRTLGRRRAWVFRAEVPERALSREDWGSPFESAADAERALYLTSKRLGLGAVPVTGYGTFEGEKGSVQRAIAGRTFFFESDEPLDADWDSIHAVVILQYVAGIWDGHGGNIMVSRSRGKNRFWAVDGETAFSRKPQEPQSALADRLGEGPRQLSRRLWTRVRNADVTRWRSDLAALGVPVEDIDAAQTRLDLVKLHGLAAVADAFPFR